MVQGIIFRWWEVAMREPKLNRSLVLETAVRVTDGAGGYTTRWEPLGVVWAEVVGKTGRHLQQGQHAAAHGIAAFFSSSCCFRIRAKASAASFFSCFRMAAASISA